MDEPRVLFWDIETAPATVYTWNQWKTNVIYTIRDWFILSVAWRWEGEDEIHFVHKIKRKGDDRRVAIQIHKLLDEADVVVAHNGDRFDLTKSNARFLKWGLGPTSPFISIDTLKEVKRHFNLYSNSLDEVARYLGLDRKVKHTGFGLWIRCMAGDADAWEEMREYNEQDIVVLEQVYYALAPYMNHPGTTGNRFNAQQWHGVYACTKPACYSTTMKPKGWHRTKASVFRTAQCAECNGYSRYKTQKQGVESGEFR